jgi:hypothetical protein
MNPALNREASEARMNDLRRRADRDALALAAKRAVKRESTRTSAGMIATILRLLQPRRIRHTLPRAVAADIDSAGTRSSLLRG